MKLTGYLLGSVLGSYKMIHGSLLSQLTMLEYLLFQLFTLRVPKDTEGLPKADPPVPFAKSTALEKASHFIGFGSTLLQVIILKRRSESDRAAFDNFMVIMKDERVILIDRNADMREMRYSNLEIWMNAQPCHSVLQTTIAQSELVSKIGVIVK